MFKLKRTTRPCFSRSNSDPNSYLSGGTLALYGRFDRIKCMYFGYYFTGIMCKRPHNTPKCHQPNNTPPANVCGSWSDRPECTVQTSSFTHQSLHPPVTTHNPPPTSNRTRRKCQVDNIVRNTETQLNATSSHAESHSVQATGPAGVIGVGGCTHACAPGW
jgi:hypothetical protein